MSQAKDRFLVDRKAARVELQRAQALMQARPREARAHLSEAKRLDPGNPDILLELGRLETRLKLYTDAIETFDRLLEQGGSKADVLGRQAFCHLKAGNLEEAAERAKHALRLDPKNQAAREVAADCCCAAKAWDEALAHLRKLNQEHLGEQATARVSFKAAQCLYQLGQHNAAWHISAALLKHPALRKDAALRRLHKASEEHAKSAIASHMAGLGWGQRLLSLFAGKALLKAYLVGRKGVDSLKQENLESRRRLDSQLEFAGRLEERIQQAQEEAKTDFLTGLANRKCLFEDWAPKLAEQSVAVLALDLDHFKAINDQHGHAIGDKVLKTVGAHLGRIFEGENRAFRLGGEEFVALVFGNVDMATELAEAFRLDLGEHSEPKVTVSIGMALYPAHGASLDEVLKKADQALYQAKAAGRNRLLRYGKAGSTKTSKALRTGKAARTAKPVGQAVTTVALALATFLALGVGSLKALEVPTEAGKLTGTAVISQDYLVGYEWNDGAAGVVYGPYADLDFRQKLFQNFTAELNLRVFKTASSDDSANLYLEDAELSYVGPWFTLGGGRRDVGNFLSPGSYFGAYPCMGERQLDSAMVTVPFRLFAEIPDADAQVLAPYNSFSLLYVPNLFEFDQSVLDGTQGLLLGQLRVKFRVGEASSDVILNVGYGLDDYFVYGTVDHAGDLDLSYDFRYGVFSLWADGAIQNLSNAASTVVAAAGGTLDARKYSWGLVDSLTLEAQLPLGGSLDNPFTGGDPQDRALGILPQWCWFAQVRNRISVGAARGPQSFFYGAACTDSVGDYTLSRLIQGSLSQPLGDGFGLGPKVEGLPLRSSNILTYAGTAFVGYEF